MAKYTSNEVTVDRVVFIDTKTLRANKQASTTAREGDAVSGPHYFVVISVHEGVAELQLLSSHGGPGKVLLNKTQKNGAEARWMQRSSYLCSQYWKAPVADVCAASFMDSTQPNARNELTGVSGLASGLRTWRGLHPI